VPRTGPRSRTFGFGCALVLAPLVGCGEDIEKAELDAESEALRLGRIEVVLDSKTEPTDEGLQVTARFAFVRGLDEDFVRARLSMPLLTHDVVKPGSCVVDDFYASDATLGPADGPRELLLVDAGDLRLKIGDERIAVPVSLVPDLVPFMSGVEYVYYGEAVATDTDGDHQLVVEAGGSQTDELPPFVAEGRVPRPIELTAATYDLEGMRRDALVLGWAPGDAETITFRITAMAGSEPVGDDLLCVARDEPGTTGIALASLRALGLPDHADSVRVQASRFYTSTFEAGEFSGTELVIERRSSASTVLGLQ
jgi:hypothetical protein